MSTNQKFLKVSLQRTMHLVLYFTDWNVCICPCVPLFWIVRPRPKKSPAANLPSPFLPISNDIKGGTTKSWIYQGRLIILNLQLKTSTLFKYYDLVCIFRDKKRSVRERIWMINWENIFRNGVNNVPRKKMNFASLKIIKLSAR